MKKNEIQKRDTVIDVPETGLGHFITQIETVFKFYTLQIGIIKETGGIYTYKFIITESSNPNDETGRIIDESNFGPHYSSSPRKGEMKWEATFTDLNDNKTTVTYDPDPIVDVDIDTGGGGTV